MIDPHVHTTTHLSRTAFSDDPAVDSFALFAGWFNAVDDEDEHANALVVCLELMRNGFTAAMEPGTVFSPDALATAAEAVGVRISLADPFVWDLDSGGNPLASRKWISHLGDEKRFAHSCFGVNSFASVPQAPPDRRLTFAKWN